MSEKKGKIVRGNFLEIEIEIEKIILTTLNTIYKDDNDMQNFLKSRRIIQI